MLSERARRIAPSATLALAAKVREINARGERVIDLGIGEPNIDLAKRVQRAGIEAIEAQKNRYTPAAGIMELREGIAKHLGERYRLHYAAQEVIVTAGAKQALANAFLTLLNKGDEVLVPVPYWVSYLELIRLADGKPVLVPTKGFHVGAEDLEKRITKRTKAILLNSPANPTGAVTAEKELKAIALLAERHDLLIISDEVYADFTYGRKHVAIASLGKKIRERTITINAFSKSASMTGLRLGYAAAPEGIIRAMAALQGHMTGGANSIAQHMALGALKTTKAEQEKVRKAFAKRRDIILDALKAAGFACPEPEGAFYAFPKIGRDANAFAEGLLGEERVAVVPGDAFGAEQHIRISYAQDLPTLAEAGRRIVRFARRYGK